MYLLYLYLKAFHIIAMTAWFAALFYIFRLFVYHVKFRDRSDCVQAYEIMEYKLLYFIGHPAMLFTIGLGLSLIQLQPGFIHQRWFHLKMLGLVVLLAYHFFAGVVRRRFKKGDYFISERACRFINEVPTLCLILMVIAVVVKS